MGLDSVTFTALGYDQEVAGSTSGWIELLSSKGKKVKVINLYSESLRTCL